MATTLVFGTKDLVNFADNAGSQLGNIDVSQFARIRVTAYNSGASAGDVTLILWQSIGLGINLELASIVIKRGSTSSTVYEIPGTNLGIVLEGGGPSANQDSIGLFIFGA